MFILDQVQDTFIFSLKVFLGKRGKNGIYNGPQLLLENLDLSETFEWTKAVVLSMVASMFDPAGLISAYIIKFKLFLREICLKKEITWNNPLPPSLMGRWRTMARELVCTPAILINRSARPPRAQGKPHLVAFSDGSSVAYTAAVYVIY